MNKSIALILGAMLAIAGCAADGGAGKDLVDFADGEGKEDRWNSSNDPRRFDNGLNYNLEDLPSEGATEQELWPASYYPTYEDSINARWQGSDTLSAAEKYDKAFNGWEPPDNFDELRPFNRSNWESDNWDAEYYDALGPLANHVSRNMGNRRDREAALAGDFDPEGDDAVETWWGLCHAWVAANLTEPRPLRSVTRNGVTFDVGDLEALLIATHNRAPSAGFIAGRCNLNGDEDDVDHDRFLERDEHGVPVANECQDTNPGAMHVLLTNYLGLRQEPVAFDRTWDIQVWNQPIRAYEITKMEEITDERALELIERTDLDSYVTEFNVDAKTLYETNLTVKWITESHASTEPADLDRYTRTSRYTYILEVDAAGKIIGGKYFGASVTDHPDFFWATQRLRTSSVPHMDLAEIRDMVRESRTTPNIGDGGTGGDMVGNGEATPNLEIPDNDANGATSTVEVTGLEGAISAVQVDVDITHTYVGDLVLILSHDGVDQTIRSQIGGSNDDINEVIDVVGFEGNVANGTWSLKVIDRAGADVGTLNRWKVIIGTDSSTMGEEPMVEGGQWVSEPNVAITDNNTVSDTITVPAGTTGDITIFMQASHSYRGDLKVSISGPRGYERVLHNRDGGSADDLNESWTLDGRTADELPFEGDAGGRWTITVSDNAAQDEGFFAAWGVRAE